MEAWRGNINVNSAIALRGKHAVCETDFSRISVELGINLYISDLFILLYFSTSNKSIFRYS